MRFLTWPAEVATSHSDEFSWSQPPANLCLDFHGDPSLAKLVVFSDGNHHMALADALRQFYQYHPAVNEIFYATTPPSVVLNLLRQESIRVGNLSLSVSPNVFISPPNILEGLQSSGYIAAHHPFMRSCGNVLLVRAANPKNIHNIADLRRQDVRLFISNPFNEAASFSVYAQTLQQFASRYHWPVSVEFEQLNKQINLVVGERIHHREAPQAVYEDRADAAILYYHLALRYTRIFPGEFDIIQLDGGSPGIPQPCGEQVITTYHIGLVGDGGQWGKLLLEFFLSSEVAGIYQQHGLTTPF